MEKPMKKPFNLNDTGKTATEDEVKVEIFPWLSRALGKESRVTLTEKAGRGETLKSLLERITLKHDGFGATIYDVKHGTFYETVAVFINYKSIAGDLNTKIRNGDIITVVPFYSGG